MSKRKPADDAVSFLERAQSCSSQANGSLRSDKRLRTDEPVCQAPVVFTQLPQAPGLQYASPLLEHALSSPMHPAASLATSSCGALSGLQAGFLVDAGGIQASATSPLPGGWGRYAEQAASASASARAASVQGSEASEATMQASTPHSQGGWQQQQAGGLQRSNSAPDLRLLLAPPLQPLLSIPPAFVQQYASASTAGALVPYKAPEEVIKEAYNSTAARYLQSAVEELKRMRRAARHAAGAGSAATPVSHAEPPQGPWPVGLPHVGGNPAASAGQRCGPGEAWFPVPVHATAGTLALAGVAHLGQAASMDSRIGGVAGVSLGGGALYGPVPAGLATAAVSQPGGSFGGAVDLSQGALRLVNKLESVEGCGADAPVPMEE